MQRQNDPRHQRRRMLVEHLFALSFSENQAIDPQTRVIWETRGKIDPIITKTAPEWPLEKLNRTDLAILRLAVFEMTIEKKQPVKVIIDEAVELAKEIGSENSPSFVNGVLGTIAEDYVIKEADEGKN